MKRVAIFAHYDKDCLIDDYVLLYLKNLKECVDDIFFISDCDVKESELRKISDIVTYSECKKHGISKDLGRYKIGFEVLLKKYRNLYDSAQELLFVNDSCYCIGKFDKIFEDTSKIDCDAWSLCDDYCNQKLSYQRYHLQS